MVKRSDREGNISRKTLSVRNIKDGGDVAWGN